MAAPRRWVILALATLMQLGVSLPTQTPAAIGPVITPALHLSRTELGLLTSAIWGGMLLGLLPSGLLIDRFGERRIIAVGGLMVAVLMVAAANTNSFLPLFLLLIPAAIAASGGSPGGTRALAAWFPKRERGLAMGIRQTGVTAAGFIAAVSLPAIASRFGWQAAFLAVAAGVAILVALFVVAYQEAPTAPAASATPFRLGDLIRSRTFVLATLFGFVFMGALGSAVTYTAVTLHETGRISIIEAGLMLAMLQVGGTIGRIGWGYVSDLSGRRAPAMAMAGAIAVLTCLATAWLVHPGVSPVTLVVLSALVGMSVMGWNALYITLASEILPDRAATVVGAGTTVTFVGLLVATPVFGAIADAAHSYTPAWIALAIWCSLGTAVVAAIRERPIASLPVRDPLAQPVEGGWGSPGAD